MTVELARQCVRAVPRAGAIDVPIGDRAPGRGTAIAHENTMRPSEPLAGRATALRSMHRLLTVMVCSTLPGCDVADPPIDKLPADQQFAANAWPALARCVGCHGSQPAIDFLAPGTAEGAYATMFGFQPPIVDVESPASSLLLTMGKHTGPALLPGDAGAVLAWLEAEHEARIPATGHPVVVGPVTLALGSVNTVDLGLGATLRLVPEVAAGGLSLRGLQLVAGPAGLHVVHPLFTSKPALGDRRIDTADTFADLDVTLTGNAVAPLGGGAALFTTFPPADPITLHFRTLEAP
jgi:mono/diheme cytochrome c family protein